MQVAVSVSSPMWMKIRPQPRMFDNSSISPGLKLLIDRSGSREGGCQTASAVPTVGPNESKYGSAAEGGEAQRWGEETLGNWPRLAEGQRVRNRWEEKRKGPLAVSGHRVSTGNSSQGKLWVEEHENYTQ